MTCVGCAAQIASKDRFCKSCGMRGGLGGWLTLLAPSTAAAVCIGLAAFSISYAIPTGSPDGLLGRALYYFFYFPLHNLDIASGLLAGAVAARSVGRRRFLVVEVAALVACLAFALTLLIVVPRTGHSIAPARLAVAIGLAPVGAGLSYLLSVRTRAAGGAVRAAMTGLLLLGLLCIVVPAIACVAAMLVLGGDAPRLGDLKRFAASASDEATPPSGGLDRSDLCVCGLPLERHARFCSGCGVRLKDGADAAEWYLPFLPAAGVWTLAGVGFAFLAGAQAGSPHPGRAQVIQPAPLRVVRANDSAGGRSSLHAPAEHRVAHDSATVPSVAPRPRRTHRSAPGAHAATTTKVTSVPETVPRHQALLLEQAQKAYIGGHYQSALQLALRSQQGSSSSDEALGVAVKAACRLGDAATAKRYWSELRASRGSARRVCRSHGVRF